MCMNKLRIGITAVSLLIGLISAFTVKASTYGTFWRTVPNHTEVRYVIALSLCPNGLFTCAVQYETISGLPTGFVLYRVFL